MLSPKDRGKEDALNGKGPSAFFHDYRDQEQYLKSYRLTSTYAHFGEKVGEAMGAGVSFFMAFIFPALPYLVPGLFLIYLYWSFGFLGDSFSFFWEDIDYTRTKFLAFVLLICVPAVYFFRGLYLYWRGMDWAYCVLGVRNNLLFYGLRFYTTVVSCWPVLIWGFILVTFTDTYLSAIFLLAQGVFIWKSVDLTIKHHWDNNRVVTEYLQTEPFKLGIEEVKNDKSVSIQVETEHEKQLQMEVDNKTKSALYVFTIILQLLVFGLKYIFFEGR